MSLPAETVPRGEHSILWVCIEMLGIAQDDPPWRTIFPQWYRYAKTSFGAASALRGVRIVKARGVVAVRGYLRAHVRKPTKRSRRSGRAKLRQVLRIMRLRVAHEPPR